MWRCSRLYLLHMLIHLSLASNSLIISPSVLVCMRNVIGKIVQFDLKDMDGLISATFSHIKKLFVE